MKITKPIKIGPAMWVHRCPLCGSVLTSAPEPDLLPTSSVCSCDKNGNKQDVYELFEQDRNTMIRRNTPPRFIGRVVFNKDTDIEVTDVLDNASPLELAKAMRKAGEFLTKKSRR